MIECALEPSGALVVDELNLFEEQPREPAPAGIEIRAVDVGRPTGLKLRSVIIRQVIDSPAVPVRQLVPQAHERHDR
ncbi:hypothetical protein SB773_33695, partial [Bacillus sp. SIMBA_074]|uniref:hypothetical protein n=1 Tax=Bacillus sp. SIMBA_074 TaxID=3085812 RepID=UPI0039791615